MKDYNTEVGKRIQHARAVAKMTKRELASRMGLHESTIKRYEDGQIRQLDIEKITEFAHKLGVGADYLMCWTDNISVKDDKRKSDLIANYEALSEDNRKLVDLLIKTLIEKEQ